MAIKILWSKRAQKGYANIVKYLEEEWSETEVRNFIRETKHFFELLRDNPYMLEATNRNKNLFRGPINRLTILTYRYHPRKKVIVFINIRSTRRKPIK